MTFARAKTLGYTDDVDVIPAAEINIIDLNQSRAVDGDAGGDYSPLSRINIGGGGFGLLGVANVNLASRAALRRQSMSGFSTSGNWSRRPAGGFQNTGAGGVVQLFLDRLAHNQVLDTLLLRWDGAAGHAEDPVDGGASPIVMPQFELFRVSQDGVLTSLGTAIDTFTVRAAYEAPHSIQLSAIAHTIDLVNNHYQIEVTGELGAGFVANAELFSLLASHTITAYSEY